MTDLGLFTEQTPREDNLQSVSTRSGLGEPVKVQGPSGEIVRELERKLLANMRRIRLVLHLFKARTYSRLWIVGLKFPVKIHLTLHLSRN